MSRKRSHPKVSRRTAISLLLMLASLYPCIAGAGFPAPARPVLHQLKGQASKQLLRKLDMRKLPSGVQLDPDEQQTFFLRAPNTPLLGIVGIFLLYDTHALRDGETVQCGVFFLQPSGASRYVPVIGSPQANLDQLCGGVSALGLADDPGPHPALIFIFNQTMPHGNDAAEPFVFTWNPATNAYDLDDKINQWLAKQPQYVSTVAQVRHLLHNRPL